MDDASRLPSIASLVSPMPSEPLYQHSSDPRWSPVQPPAVDGLVAGSTPPVGPPRNKWTAINRSTSSNGSSLGPSLASSPGRHGHSTQHQQMSTSAQSTAPLQTPDDAAQVNRRSPPRQLQREPAAALKPIIARRQDSAVSASPVSQASTASQHSPSFSSANHDGNSDSSCHSLFARDPVAEPKKPSLLAAGPVAAPFYSFKHTWRVSPPVIPKNEPNIAVGRGRAYSDSQLRSSSLPTTSATRGSMPPPPNPISAAPGAASTSRALANRSASTARLATTAPGHRRQATEPNGQAVDQLGTVPSIQAAGASNPTQRYVSDSAATTGSQRPEQCLRCNDVWTYPPPPSSTHVPPSKTINEMFLQQTATTDRLSQYNRNKEQSYQAWTRWHQTEPGDPEAKVPCMLMRNQTAENSSSNNKRKSDIPVDDGHISSKLRRLTCNSNSPPKCSQLTPPPDQPLPSSPPRHSANHDQTFRYETPSGEAEVGEQLAVILKVPGARPPYFEPSSNTSWTHMWDYPIQKSVEQEKSRSTSPPTDQEQPSDPVAERLVAEA